MGSKERREREKEQRRREIQAAASDIFLSKGFGGATMEEIAARAELTPGAIYTYFSSKEELIASLMMVPLKYMYDQMEKIYHNKKLSVEAKFRAYKEAMFNTFQRHGLMVRNVFHLQVEDTLLHIKPTLLEELNAVTKKNLRLIAESYEQGVKDGVFIPGRAMARADMMWGIFAGLVMWEEAKRKINPEKDFLKTTLDEAFEIFLRGIKNLE